jgi:hypothetical protein
MFTSPCSLRSPACAALIALATVAGISRFEPAPVKPAAPEAAENETTATKTQTQSRAQIYLAAFTALSPQPCAALPRLDLDSADGDSAAALLALAPDESWPPAPPAEATSQFPFTWTAAMPTVREHSYPYAVGPPRRGIHEAKLRAAGLARPGDSPARRSPVSRIARVFIARSHASLTRPLAPRPSSALRGGPGTRPTRRRVRPPALPVRAVFPP